MFKQIKFRSFLISSILFFSATFVTQPVIAGAFDGAWTADAAPGVFGVALDDGAYMYALVIYVDGGVRIWDLYGGPISGGVATLTDLASPFTVSAVVTLTSASTGTVKLNTCTPCTGVTPGASVPVVRLFPAP